MSSFLHDARSILETASSARGGSDIGILIDSAGTLRIVDAAGWRTDALQSHYGARTVYHVAHTRTGVRVSGRAPGHNCVLESTPGNTSRALSYTLRS